MADLSKRLDDVEAALTSPDRCGCGCHDACLSCGCERRLEFSLDGFSEDEVAAFGGFVERAQANARGDGLKHLRTQIEALDPAVRNALLSEVKR